MVASVNTGVPLPGGIVNAPGQEQQSAWTFFNVQSTSAISHKFEVHETPVYLKAFGLGDTSAVSILMVTKTPTGDLTEALAVNGNLVALTKFQNALILDFPGVYQLSLIGGLGFVTVVGGASNLSYWSWGLKGYAEATDLSGLNESLKAALGIP